MEYNTLRLNDGIAHGHRRRDEQRGVRVTFDGDYNTELTVGQDLTLATTHQEQNSSVQCVVAHWSTDLEAILPQLCDPQNRSRFTKVRLFTSIAAHNPRT